MCIFISYSRQDIVFAQQLARKLDRLGAQLWFDLKDIPAGENWSTSIQQGLETCEVMIVIVSPDSMASPNVEDEWQYFQDHGGHVIPVLARPTENIHYQLHRRQYIDFTKKSYEAAFDQLRSELADWGITLNPRSYDPLYGDTLQPTAPAEKKTWQWRALMPWGHWSFVVVMVVLIAAAVILTWIMSHGDDNEFVNTCSSLESKEHAYLRYVKGHNAIHIQGFKVGDEPVSNGRRVENNDPIFFDGHELSTQSSTLCAVFENDAFAVLEDLTIIKFDRDDNHTIILDVMSGDFIFEFGKLSTKEVVIDTPDGFRIVASSTSSSFAASYDPARQQLRYACLSGDCRITEPGNAANSVLFDAGQQVLLDTTTTDFVGVPLQSIPAEQIEQFRDLCEDCVKIEAPIPGTRYFIPTRITATQTPLPTATLTPSLAVTPSFTAPPKSLTPTPPISKTPEIPTLTPTPTTTPTLTPTLLPMQRARNGVSYNAEWDPYEGDFNGIPMVLVPVGCFKIGSNNIDQSAELNGDVVCFTEPFWINKYEVTNAQYGSVGCTQWSSRSDQPRNCVNWFEAYNFCAVRGARLPTEAEWEYAARGPDRLQYPWGNDFVSDNVIDANSADYGNTTTAPVGSRVAGQSWVGALDMSGNVWEWTNSQYKDYPYDAHDGRETYPASDANIERIMRGGSFINGQSIMHSSFRSWYDPTKGDINYGFRCARDVD